VIYTRPRYGGKGTHEGCPYRIYLATITDSLI
jgi:hypothetical protein